MGIGVLAIGVLFLAAGCVGASRERLTPGSVSIPAAPSPETEENQAVANSPAVPPVVPQFPQVHVEVTNIHTIEGALELIMIPSDPEEPIPVAFGEIHDRCLASDTDNIICMSFQTAADHLARDIFPRLLEPEYGGLREHVSEFLRNEPLVDQQLEAFLQGVPYGPGLNYLDDFMNGRDFCPVLSMLRMARDTHSRVYGTQLSLADLHDPARIRELDREAVAIRLRDYGYARIVNSLSQGLSVDYHGGMSHIDPTPAAADAVVSFGDELARSYVNYRAVAIITPEVAAGAESRGMLPPALTRIPNWRQYVPQEQGRITLVMTSVNNERSMYYIFYPRTPAASVHPLNRSEIFSCIDQPPPYPD